MTQSIINHLIVKLVPILPLPFIKIFSNMYVAGENQADALKIIHKLNKQGFSATIDILGEHSKTIEAAGEITNEYINLYNQIYSANLDCNISIKPTHLGLDFSIQCARDNMLSIIEVAKKTNNFLRIDMENSMTTDAIFYIYEKCKENYSRVGTVLQAYLYRSQEDLIKLHENRSFNFRLCKGIYKESENIAIQNRNDINENYLKMLKYAFEKKIYVGIATHDINIISAAYDLIEQLDISPDNFEFQVLYGVPMSGWLEKHLQKGYKVRIYVPFGKDWYDYSLRRLKENPNIARYILKNIFKK